MKIYTEESKDMIKAGIIGSTGYAGGELARLLLQRDDVEIKWYGSRSYIDQKYASIYQNMFKIVDDKCMDDNMKELADQVDSCCDPDRQGDPQKPGAGEELELRIAEDGDRQTAGINQGKTLDNDLGRKRCNEGLDLKLRDDQTVEQAHDGGNHECDQDRSGNSNNGNHFGNDAGRQSHDRTDRQVKAAKRDRKRHTTAGDGGERSVDQDITDAVRGAERRSQSSKQRKYKNKKYKYKIFARNEVAYRVNVQLVFHFTLPSLNPAAFSMMLSSLISSPSRKPIDSPLHMTMTRSERLMTSGRSELTTITASPFSAKLWMI